MFVPSRLCCSSDQDTSAKKANTANKTRLITATTYINARIIFRPSLHYQNDSTSYKMFESTYVKYKVHSKRYNDRNTKGTQISSRSSKPSFTISTNTPPTRQEILEELARNWSSSSDDDSAIEMQPLKRR